MSPRILAVNDDQEILDLYRLALEPEGYAVALSMMEIEDANEIEYMHPDLVILDFKLGRIDAGLLMLQQLKMYRPTKDIPIILCTAAVREIREQENILQQKGIPVLYKPFDLDELLDLVRKMTSSSE